MSVLNTPLSVKYNGTDLNGVAGVTITQRTINTLPGINQRIHKLARTDGSIITTSEYTQKNLEISGVIMQPDRASAETSLDKLRSLVAAPQGNIDIMVAGTNRRWIGTLSSMSDKLKGGYIEFSMQFACAYPFGTDINTVTLINGVTNTLSNNTYGLAIEGSYKAELYLQLVFSALTGGTAATVSLYDNVSGIGLDITRTWTAGDILEIDNLNKTVQVNGVDVARVGRFFSFQPGAGTLGYNDTLTTRTVVITANYQKRYL